MPFADTQPQQKTWEEVLEELASMEALPSANEAKSSKYDMDVVPDGRYQVRIIEISPRLKNSFDEDADRRALTFRILRDVEGEDPKYVGARFRQYLNVSSHPKSNMYAYFKAAAGGQLDPNERPRLLDLVDAQLIGTLETEMTDSGNEKQVFTALRPAKNKIVDAIP
jgi:hypothetical protein